ncbi:hypothetical protein OG21DRAFT_1125417 [Imleria badia]|nr:hypothetical protein OG21DRAFT_1125417 [Imleria badia]
MKSGFKELRLCSRKPAPTRRRLLDNLGRLVLHDLTCQSLFSHQAFLICVLEHVPGRGVGLGTVVRVGFFPIGELPTLEWRGVGHEWDVCLGRHLTEQIRVVVWGETWGCVGCVWVAY